MVENASRPAPRPSDVPGGSTAQRRERSRRVLRAENARLVLLFGVALLSGCSYFAPDPPPPVPVVAGPPLAPAAPITGAQLNSIIAVVDGEPITVADLRAYKRVGGPFLPEELRDNYKALLQSMIERRLLKAEFEKNGVKVDDATVDRYIQGILQDSGQSRAEIETALGKVGLSWKDYFERMREEVQRVALVNLLIRSRVNVPDEEVREVWEKDSAFVQNEKLEIADIYLPLPADEAAAAAVRAQAPAIAKEAKSDFADAAKKYSKGPGAGEGGKLGEFARGTMAPYFEKALTGLDKGDVSDPVEGGGGIHIVKLVSIRSSARRPFEEVKEEIREKLYQQRLQERYERWASEDLRREHRVDILVADLSGIPG